MLITDTSINAIKTKKPLHTVTIWKKANISAVKEETLSLTNKLISSSDFSDVETIWNKIHDHLKRMITKHTPTKKLLTEIPSTVGHTIQN